MCVCACFFLAGLKPSLTQLQTPCLKHVLGQSGSIEEEFGRGVERFGRRFCPWGDASQPITCLHPSALDLCSCRPRFSIQTIQGTTHRAAEIRHAYVGSPQPSRHQRLSKDCVLRPSALPQKIVLHAALKRENTELGVLVPRTCDHANGG